MAVKEHRPAVKRMKKGSSFFGYTDTSWNAGVTVGGEKGYLKSVRSASKENVHSTHRAAAPCLLFLCILGRGKISDLSLVGRGLTGTL